MEPRKSRTMEYDPVTGCYVRKVPLDFSDKKVEDIVKEEMIKSERKPKPRSRDQSWKKPEEKESGSTPDTALVDLSLRSSDGDNSLPHYVSGEGIETEYKFTVKEEIKTESKPSGVDKNGEFADEDIKKAGQELKAKFEDDRMKFERDSSDFVMSETTKRSFERRRRSDEDPDTKKAKDETKQRRVSLDRRLKDMEERRARLFKDSPEDKVDSGEVKITRTVTTETSYSAPTSSEDSMLSERMQDAHRRHRNREERIRRRKNAEELISKKTSESEDKPIKSTGVKLELRGSALKKREDTSSKNDSEPNAFSGSNYSYLHEDDASDISFTVKKPAETKKDDDDIGKFDKKESTFDWKESEQKFSVRTNETKTTSVSLMDEPIMWSQPGRGTDDDISFSVKEPSKKPDGDKVEEERGESRRSLIKETEVKVVESKPVQSLFSSDFGQEEPQDILFSVKEISTSTKSTTEDDSSKSKPKELTLERGTFDEKYSVTSTTNSDLLRWEMDNVDSGKSSEPEPFDNMDGYRDSLRRTNALGRVGSFKKGREELPPAIFHDIESDAPAASLVDIRTESPSLPAPVSKDNTMEAGQAPNLLSKLQDEDHSEERRRRRQEIEEKKRRIAESQKKANVQLRRDVSGSEKTKDGAPDTGSNDNIEDLSEKRRSLLMMWESYAEGEGPGPENIKSQEEGKSQFGYDVMMMEAAQDDPNAVLVDYRTMDVDDEKEETRAPMIDIDEYHKLNDDELKWERAGQFQPGKLKTKFHEVGKDDSSSEPKSTWRGMNNNDISGVSTKVTREEQRFSYKTPVEEDQSYADKTNEVESAPKQLWDKSQGQSTFKSDDEDEEGTSRQPHVDMDEVYHMTEEEARWEKVGHFQPGKINTSIFESRKKADKNGDESSKIQKREKSRYEQIKKIQRTDSKKELLVPKKVSLKSDRTEDVEEEVEEDEKPHVGKIATPSFHASEEDRERQEREARNRREMEEIQREREEERRRQEREYLDSKITINEFEDDEFDTKVKSKDVGKIDITKFGDFQKKSEPIPDKKPVSKRSTKRIVETRRKDKVESFGRTNFFSTEDEGYDIQVRDSSVGKLNMDSSPFIQSDTSVKETSPPRKVQERTLSKKKEIVVQEIPLEMAASPSQKSGEDEFDNMTRARSVKKLDVSRLPFSHNNYDKAQSQDNRQVIDNKPLKHDKKDKSQDKTPLEEDRKREREREKREWEDQLKRERDEIEQIKKAHDKAFQDNVKGSNEIDDTNDYETENRNVRKLDLSMFSKFQQGDAGGKKPERKTSDKASKRDYGQRDVVVVSQTTREVESAPDYSYEEDEYEIKRRSVGKLNKDWLSQAQEQEAREMERRRKETEMERIRKEQYEIELLKLEENKRRETKGDEISRDEIQLSEKPQSVKKLDSTSMTPFLKGGRPSPEGSGVLSRKKSKDEVRQDRKLARKESRSKMEKREVLYAEETEDVQESPESFDDRPKVVGKLNTGKYLQMMGEDHSDKERRKKLVEEERMRRELEEMERQREEEERKKEIDRDDTSSSSSSDRPQNVSKLDLAQFSQFQKKETAAMPKKQQPKERTRESKKIEIIERQTVDEVESQPFVPETSEREWLDKERSEALEYEEKRQNVGKLDVNRLMQSRSEEEQERQSRIKELERQRIFREREEMERLKAEKKKGKKSVDLESDTSSEASHEDHKVSSVKSSGSQHEREREEEWTIEEKRKSGVGRLNVDQFMQSMSKEEEEKNRRKLELEKERIRREAEERERLRMEQQMSSENIRVSTVQEVHSAPDQDFYERANKDEREREEEQSVEEKRKIVGRLDVSRFVQSLSNEEEEKRRRKIELEKERIRRENEERELLRLEQERKNRGEPSVTKSEESSKKYFIVHKDSREPRDDREETESRDKEKYTIIDREREEEMSVEEKRKSVGRLDVGKYMQSLNQEEEEKRRRMFELEKERIRREEEEKELLRLEQERAMGGDVSRSASTVTSKSSFEKTSRTVVQDVESSPYDQPDEGLQQPSRIDKQREEELSVEEKRKSVGRLNVNQFFQSLNEEEEEKRRRLIELEKERIRRENEERELLQKEQERSRRGQVEQVNASVVQEVHSAPPDDFFTNNDKRSSLEREREEATSVEEKRKSVGRLDFNQFIQSLSEEDKEKQMRKIELERERLRREKEEREMEERQYRVRESSSYSEKIQTSSVEVVQSEIPGEYEDGDSSQDKKEVGRLDLERYSQQFTQEARERERRARELEIERLRLEREEMEGRGGSQTVQHESWSSERRETTVIEEKRKYRGDEVDRRSEGQTESIKSEDSSDSDKPVPKKLDLSKFSAFQSGSGGKRATKDDSAVRRREKTEAGRQTRPKSIAGSSFGGVANGEARSGERVYRIIH